VVPSVALWAAERGKPGFYARGLAAVRDGLFDDAKRDASAYVAQLPYATVAMEVAASLADLSIDATALEALHGLGPWEANTSASGARAS